MPIEFSAAPVDVANEALGLLGKDPITDIEDTADPVAVVCLQYYRSLLRTLLREHAWNFAKVRVQLAENATEPLSQWAHSFTLPATCYRVLQVNNSDESRWEIEGRELRTDETTIIIEYIAWTDDPNIWDGSFHQAFVTLLASRLATVLNSDMRKSNDLYKLYQEQILDAKAIDGQESAREAMRCTVLTDDIREE